MSRIIKACGSAVLTLVVICNTQLSAQDIALVPPPEALEASAPVSAPVPPLTDAATGTPLAMSSEACASTYTGACLPAATCCQPAVYCCTACGHACCTAPGIHMRKACGKMKWCRFWTTGDMYPHYAYYPAHHGYYYYRPYNYTTVLEHKQTGMLIGANYNDPYSVAMFDDIYDAYYATMPKRFDPAPHLNEIPGSDTLPDIEELLKIK